MSDDNILPFIMTPTPAHASDSMIHRMSELDTMLLNAETILGNKPLNAAEVKEVLEHPLAAKLFRQFKAGSAILTKVEAYQIGNELNSLLGQVYDLHREMAAKIGEARETVQRLLTQIEDLQK